MDEASRVLGELDSRTHLKLSLMIENLVPIDKKKKKYGVTLALCSVLWEKMTYTFWLFFSSNISEKVNTEKYSIG